MPFNNQRFEQSAKRTKFHPKRESLFSIDPQAIDADLIARSRRRTFNKSNQRASTPQASSPVLSITSDTHQSPPPIVQLGQNKYPLLPTAQIRLKLLNGTSELMRAMCDTGSQVSVIDKRSADRVGLTCKGSNIRVSAADGISHMKTKGIARTDVTSRFTNHAILRLDLLIVASLPHIMPTQHIESSITTDRLADPLWNIPSNIDIIFGVDVWGAIIDQDVRGLPSGLTMQGTKLGNVILGNITNDTTSEYLCCTGLTNEPLEDLISKLWELDIDPIEKPLSRDDQWCEDNFANTHKRTPDGRYIVTIPLAVDHTLGESRNTALRRFFALENRFKRDPGLKTIYVDFMRQYRELNHMRPVDPSMDPGGPIYYIPHHIVLKKVRVVFDASATTSNGRSLNQVQLPGPKLQPDLVDILINFRSGRIALSADIVKMFRQIEVDPSQWNLQRIFWREDPLEPLIEYWLTVVTYGMTALAYNAVRTLIQCASDHEKEYPIAASIVRKSFYMDDMMAQFDTEAEAASAKREVTALLAKGGFTLDKWVSNYLPMMNNDQQSDKKELDPSDSAGVLGLKWDYLSDTIMINVRLRPQPIKITKRILAQESARIFDPCRLLAPVTVYAKQVMKRVWEIGTDWDVQIPAELHQQWTQYYQDLSQLTQLRIPRWVGKYPNSQMQLHIFADASLIAYGAAAYAVSINNNSVSAQLILSNNKLAPKNVTTIPKLELCAAELATRLYVQLKDSQLCRGAELFFWTDSQVVLCWLGKSSDQLKVFVGNRIAKIQRRSNVNNWRHVRSENNPADLITRGMTSSELVESSLWWSGPDFIKQPPHRWQQWQTADDAIVTEAASQEYRASTPQLLCASITYNSATGNAISLLEKSSNLHRLLNVTSRVMRFARHCLHKWLAKTKTQRKHPSDNSKLWFANIQEAPNNLISPTERECALKYWVRTQQIQDFTEEYDSLIKKRTISKASCLRLETPYLDEYNIMRVGGRLDNMDDSMDRKHPMILNGKSLLTTLLITEAHNRTLQGTVNMIRLYLRRRFHIIGARVAIRKFNRHCITCARYASAIPTQFMADLPTVRVTPARAFHSAGIDFAGPIKIQQGRGRPLQKGYILVIVCMVYKAIHLEVVTDLSTSAFLAAFDRFIALRAGQVKHVYSDNGRNFVGAANELAAAIESWQDTEVAERLSAQGITWHFNVPLNPHAGGLWERGVRSVKHHLNRIGGSRTFSYEGLSTVLARIAMCLNSRPLSSLSDDPNDYTALTPGHFIVGGPMVQPVAPDVTHIKENRLDSWQELQRIQQDFWKR